MAIAWLLGQPSRRTKKPDTNNQTEQPAAAVTTPAPAKADIPSWKDDLLGSVRDFLEAPDTDQHKSSFGLFSEHKHAPLLGKERAILDQWRVVIDRLRAIDGEAADLVRDRPLNNHLITERYLNRGVPTP